MNTDVHITRHGAQINCGVLPLYLTYDLEQGKSEISEDYVVFVIPDLKALTDHFRGGSRVASFDPYS
jgi:hypothetical protein